MSSTYQAAKHSGRMKALHKLGHYARGGRVGDEAEDKKIAAGAVHKHEGHMHKGEPETKLATGGRVGKARLDRKARGGKVSSPMGEAHEITRYPHKKLNHEPVHVHSGGQKDYKERGYARGGRAKGKGHTSVNINVGGGQQGGGADAQTAFKAGVIKGAQAAKAAIAGGGPQQGAPMMPPGGAGAPPGGGMPPGGGAPMPPHPMPPRPMPGGMPGGPMKRGGRISHEPVGGTLPLAKAMESGSGGGKGRLTKANFYGKK